MKLSKKEKEELIRLSKIHHISSTSVEELFNNRLNRILYSRLAKIDSNPELSVINSNTVANIYSAFFTVNSEDVFNRSIYDFYIKNEKNNFQTLLF